MKKYAVEGEYIYSTGKRGWVFLGHINEINRQFAIIDGYDIALKEFDPDRAHWSGRFRTTDGVVVTETYIPSKNSKRIEDQIQRIFADVSDDEWDKLPSDLSYNHDHYLYGFQKREK